MKSIYVITILLFVQTMGFAQSDLKAQIEFENAERNFSESKFEVAYRGLNKAQELIGKWVPNISYLKIKSLDQLCNNSNIENTYIDVLALEVKLYMKFATANKDAVILDKFREVYAIEEKVNKLVLLKKDRQVSEALEKSNRADPDFIAAEKAYAGKNYSIAMSLYNNAANKGNGIAMRMIGQLYGVGEGVEQNWGTTIEWYKKAIGKGDVEALFLMGSRHYGGEGVIKDYTEALKWYTKAAEKGNGDAMYKIGDIMFKNAMDVVKGIDKNALIDKAPFKEVLNWYKNAAENGNVEAMFKIGEIYRRENLDSFNFDVTPDKIAAFKWYKKAADSGNGDAMYEIGQIYYSSFDSPNYGVIHDYEEGANWWKKAAEKGHIKAEDQLIKLYDNGPYSEEDIVWLKKTAEKRNDQSLFFKLALTYHYGKGRAIDYTEAMKCYKKAAAMGSSLAMEEISEMYNTGQGVPKDKIIAKEWKAKAKAAKK